MASGDNYTTVISELVHIGNFKEAYLSTIEANYIGLILKQMDRCTGLDYMEETLCPLALKGWCNIDSAQGFNQLSAADKLRNARRAHALPLQHSQDETFSLPVSHQVHHLRETHVHRVCKSIKLTSLSDGSVDFGLPNS